MGRAGRLTALVVAASAALLLAGCTSGQVGPEEPLSGVSTSASTGEATSEPSPSDTRATEDPGTVDGTPEPDATATETAKGPPFAADTRPDTAEPQGDGNVFLSVTDIRVAEHDGYDRIVFDLAGRGSGQPGWRVEYVDRAVDDGSGLTVEVDGDAILRVSLSGTANPMDSGVEEYSGDRIQPGTEAVDEIVYRYWFEGYTTAFIGVDETERPFRVFHLENPTRVVLDIQH